MVSGKRLKSMLSLMSDEQLKLEKDWSYNRLRQLSLNGDFSAITDSLIIAETARYKAILREIVRRENEPKQMTLEDWLNAPQG